MSSDKKCDLQISMGRPLQIADSGKPTYVMAKGFPIFPTGNRFSDF
jgi:hypothetical protein